MQNNIITIRNNDFTIHNASCCTGQVLKKVKWTNKLKCHMAAPFNKTNIRSLLQG